MPNKRNIEFNIDTKYNIGSHKSFYLSYLKIYFIFNKILFLKS